MNNNRGSSIISLLIVLVIIGVMYATFINKNKTNDSSKNKPKTKEEILKPIKQAKEAGDMLNKKGLEMALQNFQRIKGRPPKSLDELVKEDFTTAEKLYKSNGEKYIYNSKDGTIE